MDFERGRRPNPRTGPPSSSTISTKALPDEQIHDAIRFGRDAEVGKRRLLLRDLQRLR
jgi:hypothetical protein